MQNSFNNASHDPQPDFRRMTVEEMKTGITTLNYVIRDLRRFVKSGGQPKSLGNWREGTKASATLAKIFPSAALVNRLADIPMRRSEATSALVDLAYPLINEAVELRAKYKTVWRARPGRPHRDLSKRISRENVRKAVKFSKDFPFMP